tara:strand:- start:435 stop:656 length:222 start_codon:yes stop_codon:yes gene_type:complete
VDDLMAASAEYVSDENAIPAFSKDLLVQLDLTYPARCKLPAENEEDHQRYAGKRELIDELLSLLEDQESDGLR